MKKLLLYLLAAASLPAANLTVSSDVDTLMTAANYAAIRTQLALTIGTNVQAYDADLTTYAGITPAANTQSLLGAADYAAMRGLLDLEAGTDFLSVSAIAAAYQPLDTDLTTLAGLGDPGADRILFWDDSAGAMAYLTAGSGLTISGTTISSSGGSGDVATDAIWNAAGDLAYGTGSDTATRLAIGTAGQLLQVNSGATAPEWTATPSVTSVTATTVDATSLEIGGVAITSSGAELNILDGVTATATELNYVDGVTSAIQTQLDSKAPGLVVKIASANYTVGTDNANELKGGVIYVNAAATITIPAVASGVSFTVITIGANAVSVDPNASDLIFLDGTALSDGDKITNTSTAGDIAVFTYYDATGWHASTNSWTDGN